jgi:hypothetical protein
VSLIDLNLPTPPDPVPSDVRSFLREAERRIWHFQSEHCIPAFVPSDYEETYRVLRALAAEDLAPGRLFCEWGSGFGVVTCLAAMLDFDAFGIEIEDELVDEARRLADDFDLPVEFMHGSFIPHRSAAHLARDDRFAWLNTDGSDPYPQLGLDPCDFGVIFAYPWPDEEEATEALFDRYGGDGAVLTTYHGGKDFRLRRRKAPRRSRARG